MLPCVVLYCSLLQCNTWNNLVMYYPVVMLTNRKGGLTFTQTNVVSIISYYSVGVISLRCFSLIFKIIIWCSRNLKSNINIYSEQTQQLGYDGLLWRNGWQKYLSLWRWSFNCYYMCMCYLTDQIRQTGVPCVNIRIDLISYCSQV
jgi:hypothetical protein